jgi:hypothetical protein
LCRCIDKTVGNYESALQRIQRDFQFVNEPMWVERAAGKISAVYLNRGDLAAAIIDAKNQLFSIRSFVDIHFPEGDLTFPEKLLHPAAVAAPGG